MLSPHEIDIDSLPFLPLTEREFLPHKSGIYFLSFNKEEIVYIGRTWSVRGFRGRWDKRNHHIFKKIEAERIDESLLYLHYYVIPSIGTSISFVEEVEILELKLIHIYRPRLVGSKVLKMKQLYGVSVIT